MNLRTRLTRVCTGDHCLFVSRSLFEQVGGYPAIDLMEDVAISKRLRRYARPLTLRAPVITSSRRWQRDGIWRTVLLMWKLRLLYFLGAKPDALARQYYPADAGQKPVKS